MISLNMFQKLGTEWRGVELVFLVDIATEDILRAVVFDMLVEENWVNSYVWRYRGLLTLY